MRDWWIHEPCVKASGNPTDRVLRRLRVQGFTHLVSLLDERRQRPAYDVRNTVAAGWTRKTFAIPEGEAPGVGQLVRIIRAIRPGRSGRKTLVHCSTGRGRAATVGVAYWIDRGLSPLEAVSKIRAAVGCAFLTASRARVLTRFAGRRRTP